VRSERGPWSANIHYAAGIAMAIALVPALMHLNIPVRFDWVRLLSAYWLVLAAQSIFLASLLQLLCFPSKETRSFLQRLRQDRARIVFILAFFTILAWMFTWIKALVLTVDTLAILELHTLLPPRVRRDTVVGVLVPALYLFAGFLLVFSYNDIILSLRFYGAADGVLKRMDTWLLHGSSVSALSRWAVRVFPISLFRFLEFVYFGMFAQIGAALILTSLRCGRSRGLRFVGTILAAYYLALILFAIWPSQGPFYIGGAFSSQLPRVLQTYAIQKQALSNSQALWNHVRIRYISADYYIAFPCMHLAQPLIAMWFLRSSKRTLAFLAVYNSLLVAAILLLEWHYVVDLFGGVLVAACAVALVDRRSVVFAIDEQTCDSGRSSVTPS
jgi:PAP2 superfamily